MTSDDHGIDGGSATDLAIERALEAADLRFGDAPGASTALLSDGWRPSVAEAGDFASSIDPD